MWSCPIGSGVSFLTGVPGGLGLEDDFEVFKLCLDCLGDAECGITVLWYVRGRWRGLEE